MNPLRSVPPVLLAARPRRRARARPAVAAPRRRRGPARRASSAAARAGRRYAPPVVVEQATGSRPCRSSGTPLGAARLDDDVALRAAQLLVARPNGLLAASLSTVARRCSTALPACARAEREPPLHASTAAFGGEQSQAPVFATT